MAVGGRGKPRSTRRHRRGPGPRVGDTAASTCQQARSVALAGFRGRDLSWSVPSVSASQLPSGLLRELDGEGLGERPLPARPGPGRPPLDPRRQGAAPPDRRLLRALGDPQTARRTRPDRPLDQVPVRPATAVDRVVCREVQRRMASQYLERDSVRRRARRFSGAAEPQPLRADGSTQGETCNQASFDLPTASGPDPATRLLVLPGQAPHLRRRLPNPGAASAVSPSHSDLPHVRPN